ncbi:hypothetical protein [Mycoplasmopsis bovis]|uniref:hypothetical protein n=1 Tax=Mycoplasmopsis bovis TaxID=28903 RepID=UPI003D2DE9BE
MPLNNEVIELCQYAKDLGFYSFWISEQHNVNSLVISSPLILLNHLANKVGKIKLGCGGIMLNFPKALFYVSLVL